MENLPKLTNSPTIQRFQHFLIETTPFLGMRKSTMTVVYEYLIWKYNSFIVKANDDQSYPCLND